MDIFLNILFLILGMFLLIKGADFFVDGASAVAKRFKVPIIFIGLTIVALGTSLPELSVSIASAIKNNVDMSVGNIIGSNLCNTFLILGLMAIVRPVPISKSNKKIDFPILIGITGLLLLFCSDTIIDGTNNNIITRRESLVLVTILIVYMIILILNAKNQRSVIDNGPNATEPIKFNENKTETETKEKNLKIWQIIVYIIIGLGGVIFGAECVVQHHNF